MSLIIQDRTSAKARLGKQMMTAREPVEAPEDDIQRPETTFPDHNTDYESGVHTGTVGGGSTDTETVDIESNPPTLMETEDLDPFETADPFGDEFNSFMDDDFS